MARRKAPHIPDALLDQLLAGADPKTAFDATGCSMISRRLGRETLASRPMCKARYRPVDLPDDPSARLRGCLPLCRHCRGDVLPCSTIDNSHDQETRPSSGRRGACDDAQYPS